MSTQEHIRIERVGGLFRIYSTYDQGEFIDLERKGMRELLDWLQVHAREFDTEANKGVKDEQEEYEDTRKYMEHHYLGGE